MYHSLWPEGEPSKAFQTTSFRKALWYLFKCRFYYQLPWNWNKARRMRWSRADLGYPIPTIVEQRLEAAAYIPPPGGWPLHIEVSEDTLVYGEVITNTYSVV